MNLLEGRVSVNGGVSVDLGGNELPIPEQALANYPRLREWNGRDVIVGLRAGDLHPAQGFEGMPHINADVEIVEALGGESMAYFKIAARRSKPSRSPTRTSSRARTSRASSARARTSSHRSRRTCSCASATACRSRSTRRTCTSSTRRVGIRSASCAIAAFAAIALASVAGAQTDAGPPTGPALAALSQLPAQSSLASQRIYFVMPDRYANDVGANDTGGLGGGRARTGFDPTDSGYYHGGDLKGLADRMQRIKDLGFTALWITPVLKQQTVSQGSAAYHGYWGLDFTTVDPHLGTDKDFADVVAAAHGLGMKVYLDVVVNHTADVVQLTGTSYTDVPYRDCHGRRFNPARYVTAKSFPCLKASTMPRVPFVLPGDRKAKSPAWLNDPLNYHDRGNIDFGSCSQACFEQGDFFGLDDLFTEKPAVMKGLAQIYSSWITRFKVDGFRVDTAKHVNAAFFKLWVPRVRAAARSVGVKDFPVFGEVTLNDAVDLSEFVRDRGLPQVLDFPFQQVAVAYASGASGARGLGHRLDDDDYFRTANGVDPAFTTFLGNHDMGRGAQQVLQQAPGLSGDALVQRMRLAYDVLYLLRGAPTILYGDEVGMIGSGGDKAARQDMFPTQVSDWQTEKRVGSPPIGKGSSFDVATSPMGSR